MIDGAIAQLASAEAAGELRRAGPEALQRPGPHRRGQRPAGAADPVAAAATRGRPPAGPRGAEQRAPAGRPCCRTAEAEAQSALSMQGGRAAGAPEPQLRHHHRPRGRHRRRPLASCRPVRAGRHAAHGGRAAARGLRRGELQGDPAHRRSAGPASGHRGRHLPRCGGARRGGQHRTGQRPGVRTAAAGQRHRQLHQDRSAHPGEDHAAPTTCALAGLLRPGMSVEPTIDTRTHDRAHAGAARGRSAMATDIESPTSRRRTSRSGSR